MAEWLGSGVGSFYPDILLLVLAKSESESKQMGRVPPLKQYDFFSLGRFLKPSQRVPPFNYVKATALAHIQGHAYKHKTQTHIQRQRQTQRKRRRESKEGSILLDFIQTPLIRGQIKLDANRKFILNTN